MGNYQREVRKVFMKVIAIILIVVILISSLPTDMVGATTENETEHLLNDSILEDKDSNGIKIPDTVLIPDEKIMNNLVDSDKNEEENIKNTTTESVSSNSDKDSDTEPPTAPLDFRATLATNDIVDLVWAASSDDVGVSEYEVFCNDQSIGLTQETEYSYKLSGVATYHFYVAAHDAAGNVSNCSTSVDIYGGDIEAPTIPDGLAILLKTDNQLIITWDASSDNTGVSEYKIFRNNNEIATVNSTIYTDDNFDLQNQYIYTIRAVDSFGNISDTSTSLRINSEDNEPPSIPGGLSYTDVTDSKVMLAWDDATDNIGIAGYSIYRDDIEIGTTSNTNYTDESVQPNTQYIYTVRAVDTSGNTSEDSNSLLVKTETGNIVAPPTNLVLVDLSSTAATIAWTESVSSNVTEYMIFNGEVCIGSISGTTNYVVSDLQEGTEYCFTVKAKDKDGNLSPNSNALVITTKLGKPLSLQATVNNGYISVNWEGVAGAESYELNINGEIIEVENSLFYLQTNFISNYEYTYKVRSKKGNTYSDWGEVFLLTTGPAKVQNLATRIKNDTTVILTWSPVDGATGYEIEIDGIIIDSIDGTIYEQKNIEVANNHSVYRVRAVKGDAKGIWSDAVSQDTVKEISGTISQDTMWSGYIIINGNVIIPQGVTVTIAPGTIIKMGNYSNIVIQGSINARSVPNAPILITTVRDIDFGGDGGNSSALLIVDYDGCFTGDNIVLKVSMNINGSMSLNYSTMNSVDFIIYSQKDVSINNSIANNTYIYLGTNNEKITINNNNFLNSDKYNAITLGNCSYSNINIEFNSFKGNGRNQGISFTTCTGKENLSIRGNRFENMESPITVQISNLNSDKFFNGFQDNSYKNNTYNSILVLGSITKNVVFSQGNEYSFYATYVEETGNCVIEAGVVINTDYITGNGKLVALGTVDKPIIINPFFKGGYQYKWTGINYSGDFTGSYLNIYEGNSVSFYGTSKLEHITVENCGYVNIYAEIKNSLITNCHSITIDSNSYLAKLDNCSIEGNDNIVINTGNIEIEGNTFQDNQNIYI